MEDAAGMAALREMCFRRAKGICEICGKPAAWDGFPKGDMMHKVFRSHGGSDSLDNVEWGCHDCHMKRDHRGPQWSMA